MTTEQCSSGQTLKDKSGQSFEHARCAQIFQRGWEHCRGYWDALAEQHGFPNSSIMYEVDK